MKTLDEVIKALEYCTGFDFVRCQDCPGYSEPDCGVQNDALQYLRTYRENQHAYEEGNRKAEEARERYIEAVKNCELAENKYRKLCKETSQNFADTSQITCPKCHSEFMILDDPDGDHQQLIKARALLQDFYRNDPLSWDELKQMEGKPVWLVDTNGQGEWVLLSGMEGDELFFVYRTCNEYKLYREEQGKTWQAYRKERDVSAFH